MKLLNSVTHIYKKMSTFGKILLFISLLLILVVFFRKIQQNNHLNNGNRKEGFEQNGKFSFKKLLNS